MHCVPACFNADTLFPSSSHYLSTLFRRVHVATPRCDRLRECFLFFFSFVTSVLVIRGSGSAVVFVHHGDHLLLLFERNQTIRDSAKGSVLLDRCLFSDLYT